MQVPYLCVVSGRMELLPSFLCARFSAAAVISLASPVCCFRALLHFVQSAARPSQDIVSMSTAFISISYADIFISQVRVAGRSSAQCQLTVEDVFWNATRIRRMGGMCSLLSCPACSPCLAAIQECAGNTGIVVRPPSLSSQTAWGLSTLEP